MPPAVCHLHGRCCRSHCLPCDTGAHCLSAAVAHHCPLAYLPQALLADTFLGSGLPGCHTHCERIENTPCPNSHHHPASSPASLWSPAGLLDRCQDRLHRQQGRVDLPCAPCTIRPQAVYQHLLQEIIRRRIVRIRRCMCLLLCSRMHSFTCRATWMLWPTPYPLLPLPFHLLTHEPSCPTCMLPW